MGLIRDALGSALGANDVKNGFGGPKLPHRNRNRSRSNVSNGATSGEDTYDDYSSSPSAVNNYGHDYQRPGREQYDTAYVQPMHRRTDYSTDYPQQTNRQNDLSAAYLQPRDARYENDTNIIRPRSVDYTYHDRANWQQSQYARQSDNFVGEDEPPPYGYLTTSSEMRSEKDGGFPRQGVQMNYQHSQPENRSQSRFRPVALPQTTFGDGKPFLRAYTYVLQEFGISSSSFIQIVDAINVAIIPNPETQIFQKGASIAGFFVPGAASLGLMAGQVAVGIGGAMGHSAMVNKVLSRANIEVFLPAGLEICIGNKTHLDKEAGIMPSSSRIQVPFDAPAEERLAAYGNHVAQLDEVFPPVEHAGRRDPLAAIGSTLGNRANAKKVEKAREELAKGEGEDKDRKKVESGMKWLLVRRASPGAMAEWEKVLHQSNAAMDQAQSQGGPVGRTQHRRY